MPTRQQILGLLPRLQNAVEQLLLGPGVLRRRVSDAYRDQLLPFHADEFPTEELRQAFRQIRAAMDEYEVGNLDRIEAAAHLMSGSKARSVARKIFQLYTGVVDVALYDVAEPP